MKSLTKQTTGFDSKRMCSWTIEITSGVFAGLSYVICLFIRVGLPGANVE
jgi:hypothetical protein